MQCEVDGVTFHSESSGSGIPLLVMHGVSLDRSAAVYEFEPVFSDRSGWQRIYVDLPGHGATLAPDWLTSIDQLLELIVRFVDAILPDRRLAVAGTSFGGYLAQGLIHLVGERLDGVCLVVPSVSHMRNVVPARTVLAGADGIAQTAQQRGWPWYAELAVSDRPSTREYGDAISRTVSDASFFRRIASIESAASFDGKHPAAPFAAPSLIITGRQDHVAGFEDAWRLARSYQRTSFCVLDAAGHLLRGEQPALFSALVGDWLDRVEEWVNAGRPAG